jgi:hypothetical protein
MKPLKVKDLIKALEKKDPEALVLVHFNCEIGKKISYGYFSHKDIKTVRVYLKKGFANWYLESKGKKGTKGKKAIIFC